MAARRVGRFRILELLGKGGMASVWRAEDEMLGRTVALKLLADDLAESPSARRRFRHEAEIATRLDHPSIVPILAHGEDEGLTWIAMGLIDGETLVARIARGPLPVDEALRVADDVAEALGYAHLQGVVHRDVTSNNVMIAVDGRVFVLDFGLARAEGFSRITSTGVALGTYAYLAPEVLRGAAADARSDFYGLGIALYEMLTGSTPFAGQRVETLAYRAANEDPEPPSRRRAGLDETLDGFVLRAIAREPAARFQDAAEFRAALAGVRSTRAESAQQTAPGAGVLARALAPDGVVFLAVGPIECGSEALAPLGASLAGSLRARLSGAGRLRMVEPPAPADPAAWREFSRATGVNAILAGRLRESGARVRLELWLTDPESGARLAGGHADGLSFEPFALEDAAVAQARRLLELPADLSTEPTRAMRVDPAADEHYARALRYLERHDDEASVDGAVHLLENLTATRSPRAEWWAALSRGYLARYNLAHQRSWEARAAEACHHAMELAPDAASTRIAHGNLLALSGHDGPAREEFERALLSDPGDPDAWLGLARMDDRRNHFELALHACARVIELRPGDWRGPNLRGRVLYRAGRFEEAVDAWRAAAGLSPENALVAGNLGAALAQMDRLDEAERELRRAIGLLPEARSYANLGTVLFASGRVPEAVEAFEHATRMNSGNAVWWGNLGNACRFVKGLEGRAREALDHAIALMRDELDRDPEDPEMWARLADWLQVQGHEQEASAAIERALAMAPGNAHCLVQAAFISQLRGERDRTLEFLRRALDAGYGVELIRRSPQFESLRESPEFKRLLDRHAAA